MTAVLIGLALIASESDGRGSIDTAAALPVCLHMTVDTYIYTEVIEHAYIHANTEPTNEIHRDTYKENVTPLESRVMEIEDKMKSSGTTTRHGSG